MGAGKNIFKTNSWNISVKLFAIATPIIVQNLVQYLQLQVDMAMLGHYNPIFLAAVGNVIFPYSILYTFISAISVGTTVLIAHALGAKAIRTARRYSEVSFFYNILISAVFFLLLFLFSGNIMNLMGTSADIGKYGSRFMGILSYSFLFEGIEFSIVSIILGIGKTRAIMYAAIIRTTINIALDWILIYGKIGFPEMGIDGAALATTIANAAAAIFFLAYLISDKKLPFKPGLAGIFKPKWRIEKSNIVVGLPFGLETMLWSFGQLILVRLINGFDPYSTGLFVLVARIQAVSVFFYMGLARGTLTLVGIKMGEGKYKEAVQIGLLSLKYALVLCLIAATFFMIMPAKILGIFTTDILIINQALPLMSIIAINVFPVSVNVVIGNAIRGMKDTKWMFYTQTFGTIYIIAMSAVLLYILHFKLAGVFLAIMTDETIRAGLNFYRFYKGRNPFRRRKNLLYVGN
jgi:putative MATE family efflux protein